MKNQYAQGSDSTSGSPTDVRASTPKITREVAKKVLSTVDVGLAFGVGDPIPGEMCVEAAVCFALGLPHGDDPGCVAQALRRLKIRLNDASWSSPQVRARGLRRLALAQLGSKDALDEREFIARVIRLAIAKHVTAAFIAAASDHLDRTHQVSLKAVADDLERRANRASCFEARDAAFAAVNERNVVARVAAEAANAAGYAVSVASPEEAASWLVSAVEHAARAVDRAAETASKGADARDKLFAEFAEDVVSVLVEMKAPGCEWLDLTDERRPDAPSVEEGTRRR